MATSSFVIDPAVSVIGLALGAFLMATTGWTPDLDDAADVVDYYRTRPVEFFEDMGFTLADTQKAILRACLEHNRILVISGNGTGKTAAITMAVYWYWVTRWNANVLVTSGQYAVMMDTSFPFLRTIHKRAQETFPVIGDDIKSPPGLKVDEYPEWWIRYYSPKDPDNLQGRHSRRAMVVIEEADKPGVEEGHFGAARSTATSADDIVIAVANPPEDRSNVVLPRRGTWHTIEFSSFDSHNVQADLGELDDDPRGRVPGLADLDTVVEDYESYNRKPWPKAPERTRELLDLDEYPGAKALQKMVRDGDLDRQTHLKIFRPGADVVRSAITTDEDTGLRKAREDTNLDPRWYRTRLGVMPPHGRGVLRPWYESDVDAAVDRFRRRDPKPITSGSTVEQFGTDIARGGGDRTVLVARRGDGLLDVRFAEPTEDHNKVTKPRLKAVDDDLNRDGRWYIDGKGEGSGVADDLRAQRWNVKRFDSSKEPHEADEYRNMRTEALVHLGRYLEDDAMVRPNSRLERELRAGARVLELKERELRSGTVLQATGKDALKSKDHLGRSPDILDAAMLACYQPGSGNEYDPDDFDIGGVVG